MILSIETTTPVCSVALHHQDKLIAHQQLFKPQAHSDMLTVMLDSICKQSQIQLADVEAVALSKGPGSYTGLRIGTATAKGLCFALNIPLIAVNTLAALAHQIIPFFNAKNTLFCPMLDARRMEVYTAIFDNYGKEMLFTCAKIIEKGSFDKFLEAYQVVFFGNGASKCQETLKHPHAIFLEGIHTSATSVGKLAFQKFQNQEIENLAYFEPYYLKDFVAIKPKKNKSLVAK